MFVKGASAAEKHRASGICDRNNRAIVFKSKTNYWNQTKTHYFIKICLERLKKSITPISYQNKVKSITFSLKDILSVYVLSSFMSLCALLTVNKELFYIHRRWDILFTYGLYTEALNADIKWFIIHFAVIVFLYRNRGREQWWPHKSYTWFSARLQYLHC